MAKKKFSREEMKEFKGGKYTGGPAEEKAEKKNGKRMAMGGKPEDAKGDKMARGPKMRGGDDRTNYPGIEGPARRRPPMNPGGPTNYPGIEGPGGGAIGRNVPGLPGRGIGGIKPTPPGLGGIKPGTPSNELPIARGPVATPELSAPMPMKRPMPMNRPMPMEGNMLMKPTVMKKGGMVKSKGKTYAKGGMVKGSGCAQRGVKKAKYS